MVLTKSELIASLEHEERILVHLAGKVEASMLDYRPTPKQRSTIELLRYMSMMGPTVVEAINAEKFDPAKWTAAANAAAARGFDETVAVIDGQTAVYAALIGAMADADLRGDVQMFGVTRSRGSHIVNIVLSGHAAYRTQLFIYLKACGRTDLNTMNLWAGMDPPPKA
jgi:hypothetical protein